VGCFCSTASGVVRLRGRGARHCEAERPEGVRIPSWDVGLMQRRPRKPPIPRSGLGRPALKKLQRLALYSSHTTLHRHRARRTGATRDVAYISYIHSACRSVKRRARSKTSTFGQGVFLTHRQTRGDRATPSERPEHSGDSAAVLDQRGDDLRAKTRWWKKSTTK
jgi:hypothetical protein